MLRVGRIVWIAATILLVLRLDLAARDRAHNWAVLKNCQLIANPANDGDSFHVRAGGTEYLFRLYFVDAPETDEMTPRRLIEQAKYFGITVPQAIELGREAKEFTRQKLSQPFTVLTRLSDAMGQSRIERFYAFVQTSDGDLGELLVRNGLARNYGFKTAPPGLGSSRIEQEKLQQLEDEAKREKIGAWAVNAVRTEAHAKEKIPFGKIDINTATEKELTAVPGIGHVIAFRIIAVRPFRSADDLKRVSGIGDKKYARIRPYFQ